jgi:phage FluMu gp28-like protein
MQSLELKFFRPSQKALIANNNRDIVVQWARGNGKTFTIACKIALHTFRAEASGKHEDWLIASATRDQAREAIDMVARWCKVFFALGKEIGIIEEELRTPDGKEIFTRFLIRIGKQRIMAQAASPSAARGYTANIWWDEAAHHSDGKEMYEALRHCTRGIFRMIVSGTPWGDRENQFYKLVHNEKIYKGKPLWSKSIVDILQAVAEGRIYDVEREQEQSDPDKWAREMMLQWVDGVTQWLPQSLLLKCRSPLASYDGSKLTRVGLPTLKPRIFFGNDIGIRGDRWVLWVLQKEGHLLKTIEVVEIPGGVGDWDDRENKFFEMWAKYNPEKAMIDQGGMGERSTEKYLKKFGTSRVEGVIFNMQNKAENSVNLKAEAQAGRLWLPAQPVAQVDAIEEDLRSIVRCVTNAGNVVFTADRRDGSHADYYWALALATAAALSAGEPPRMPKTSKRRGESRAEEMAGFAIQ